MEKTAWKIIGSFIKWIPRTFNGKESFENKENVLLITKHKSICNRIDKPLLRTLAKLTAIPKV